MYFDNRHIMIEFIIAVICFNVFLFLLTQYIRYTHKRAQQLKTKEKQQAQQAHPTQKPIYRTRPWVRWDEEAVPEAEQQPSNTVWDHITNKGGNEGGIYFDDECNEFCEAELDLDYDEVMAARANQEPQPQQPAFLRAEDPWFAARKTRENALSDALERDDLTAIDLATLLNDLIPHVAFNKQDYTAEYSIARACDRRPDLIDQLPTPLRHEVKNIVAWVDKVYNQRW